MRFEDLTFFGTFLTLLVVFTMVCVIIHIIYRLITRQVNKEDTIPTLPEIKEDMKDENRE